MNNKIIELKKVSKVYRRGSEKICAVNKVDLVLNKGDFCAVVGTSGSGKTTLMNLIGCIDNPSVGTVKIKNKDVSGLPQKDLTRIRRDTLGFVFQQFFLIPTLTASENVQIPGLFAKNSQRVKRAEELLDLVGLSGRIHHRPGEMSGGEMQRTAIARALINSPEILLADEPTGNLDSENAKIVFDTFKKLNKAGLTIIVVTHSKELAKNADKIITIKDGKIQTD